MEAKQLESMAMARLLLTQRVIAFHPVIAKITNDVKAALFFCQLMYWSDKGDDQRGWIWKTREQWQDETALTRREQETARGRLRKLDLIEEHRRGQPPLLYYRVKWRTLEVLLQAHVSMSENAILDGGNVHSKMSESAIPSSKTTTETTTPYIYMTEPKTAWIAKLREIAGWETRGASQEQNLVIWQSEKGFSDEYMMDTAIGVGSQQSKNLKASRNLAQKFQVAANKRYYGSPNPRNSQTNGSAPSSGHNDGIMNRIKERKAASNGQ